MGCSGLLGTGLLCFVAACVASYDPRDFAGWPSDLLSQLRAVAPESPRVDSAFWSPSNPWAVVDVSQPRALTPLAPVSVRCEEARVVVLVKRDLFGTGRLVQAADLSLGSSGCKPTSLDAAEDAVIFETGLHECGSTMQMTPDSLIYSFRLYYKPALGSNPVIIRTSPVEVPIECHYPRKDNVSSQALKPTWVPFSSTLSAEERLVFSLRLMNDDWTAERASKRYQLGDALRIQADVSAVDHVALRLLADRCVATLSPDGNASPTYSIIDFHGCLVDGRAEDSRSAFVTPRSRPDSLRFMVDAFRFAQEQGDAVYITCHLKVVAGDQSPDALNKACSFNKARSSWSALEGPEDVCRCCEARNCGISPGQAPGTNTWWRRPGGRSQREIPSPRRKPSVGETEADVLVGPFVLEELKTSVHLRDERPSRTGSQAAPEASLLLMLGLTVATGLLASVAVGLALLLACRKSRRSNS